MVKIRSTSGSKKQKAVIQAVKSGKATITATSGKTRLKATITVKTITVNKKKVTVKEGKTYTLKLKNADKTVKWSTSDKSIVKLVKSSGSKKQNMKIKGVKGGSATITAKVGTTTLVTTVTVKHVHKWKAATCTAPKTCTSCGATSGKAAGHVEASGATCVSDSICARCFTVLKKATGHSWSAATCDKPATCSNCGATQGSALGHVWSNATCQTPSVCSRCGATAGGTISHVYEDGECTMCGRVKLEDLLSFRLRNLGNRTNFVQLEIRKTGEGRMEMCMSGTDTGLGRFTNPTESVTNLPVQLCVLRNNVLVAQPDGVSLTGTVDGAITVVGFHIPETMSLGYDASLTFTIRFRDKNFRVTVTRNAFGVNSYVEI